MKIGRLLILVLWYMAMSCATQTTPMGGPKDTIPPTVVQYRPKENQTNFKGKEITAEFSEAVQLNNPKEQIIIIPSVGKKTEFKLRGNTLVITPELPLRDSTTYNISFREGVKDLTEGNLAIATIGRDTVPLHLAFSTGPIIDTLMISGQINGGLTDVIPEDITVALYQSDTFDIFKHTPDFFTKSTKDGKFSITNLKAGKYRLYAFADKNKNLKAETRSEKFGFLADTIRLDSMVRNLKISVVNIDTRLPGLTSVRNPSNVNTIRFNKSLTEYQLTARKKVQSHFSNNQTEIIAYFPDSLIQINPDSTALFAGIDSLQVHIKGIDSTQQIVDTLVYIRRNEREKIEETFTVTASESSYNIDNGLLELSMTFNKPIKFLNPDSVYLDYDTATRIPIKLKHIKFDTAFNKISVRETVPIDSLPIGPKITFAKGYLISIDNDTSKVMTSSMKLIDTPTTAVLIVEVQTKEPHFIIQLVSGSKVVQQAVDQKKITFKYLNPESLKVRAIIDTNGNGKWDTAIYPQNREPEKVVYFLNTNKKAETPLRQNWEVGPLIFRF
ncbi:MAG TPA: Ig-like domain-containing domain [Cyclobacteriaceae bacterium]|nr:Ig-like domain-containing domain [Cyclobacteriaceae bacterium]